MSVYNQFSSYGVRFVSQLILIYGYIVFYLSLIFYKFCYAIITYYPDKYIPNKLIYNPENINIQNIQYASSNSHKLNDITNKGKILIKLLWSSKIKSEESFLLHDFLLYLNDCIIIYIDYQIKENPDSKYINIKKIIDTSIPDRPKYINKKEKTEIPFGIIHF